MAEPERPATALTERQQHWLDHITRCDASGSSTKDYAMDHGLSVQAMYAARKVLVERGVLEPGGRGIRTEHAPRFTRVLPAQPATGHRSAASNAAVSVQLQLTNGTVVGFPEPLGADALRLVLQTAASLP